MNSAAMPPEQEEMGATNNRHIPAEIVEEILLNLRVKSLVRFSSVSKLWNSMIFESGFIRKHHSRAALPGRERIVISPYWCDYIKRASTCPLFSISSENPFDDATELICPFQVKTPYLHAFCDELWCVSVSDSLFLWNPSIGKYRKLPDPSLPILSGIALFEFVYGLGYDSVGDDYKILKIPKRNHANDYPLQAELYSLRSNSWKKIQPFPGNISTLRKKGVFVSGALHWMVHPYDPLFHPYPYIHLFHPNNPLPGSSPVIISFDLSSEKYGEVAQPEYSPMPSSIDDKVEVTVLRGKLCVFLNYYRNTKFVLWVMEEYGVGKSWSKTFDIDYYDAILDFPPMLQEDSRITLRPLYFTNNGEILIKVFTSRDSQNIYMYKDEKIIPQKIVGWGSCSKISDAFLYVESLISPAMWPLAAAPEVGSSG